MASSSPSRDSLNGTYIPLYKDDITFEELQRRKLGEIEARLREDIKRKRHEWAKNVDAMRSEFLYLHPVYSHPVEEGEAPHPPDNLEPWILTRKGSTDILDKKKMKTLFMENPDHSGHKFKLRFDVADFDPHSIRVHTDGERIIVRASKIDEEGKPHEYIRKIQKPDKVNAQKLKSFLTRDMILIIEASMPPSSFSKQSTSPSRSSYGLGSRGSGSPNNSMSPSSPSAKPKYNLPTFHGEENERFLSLIIDIGFEFSNKEITVQVINDQCMQVKAKHESRTSELLKKCKFHKEYELSEKIETYSLRAGLTTNGKLVIGALGKGHTLFKSRSEVGEAVARDIQSTCSQQSLDLQSCNVLDLASFPPTAAPKLTTSTG